MRATRDAASARSRSRWSIAVLSALPGDRTEGFEGTAILSSLVTFLFFFVLSCLQNLPLDEALRGAAERVMSSTAAIHFAQQCVLPPPIVFFFSPLVTDLQEQSQDPRDLPTGRQAPDARLG